MSTRRAFTLIELAIALLVMGILAGVAAPRYADSLAHFRVESAARRVAADMAYARRQAIDNAASRTITFDAAADSYELDGVDDIDHRSQRYIVSFAAEGYPVDLTSADFGGAATLTFNHYGEAQAAGTVQVRSGDHVRTVTVSLPNVVTMGP